ncbi:hypothetical protein MTAT_26030 [Moorella thermoacetica]|uniref:TrbL/VirB6 plasmid conjugal transfer protein n=1 Tax=Neomoorella thermoacetica TaxID=1525 RepID=A0AAC9HFX0_NEOTH|nr:hypothetical protein [Moorella thermoacetica]AOQ23094.1 hypothetical protein Maut_00631 [Moorella thermoacetica]TYL08939.1 hypothetical protein MTAT_26030 [Moorella thermoacetica]
MLWAKLSTKNSRNFKRLVAALLLAAIVLAAAAPAWAAQRHFIGDEPADQNNLTGDVAAERQTEDFLMPLGAGSSVSTASLGAGIGPGFVAGTLLTALSTLANYKGLPWQNWPMGRYLFWHYPPDKVLGFIPQMSGITLWAMDTFASGIFSVTKFLVTAGINLMFLTFNSDWLVGMADWIGAAARDIFTFNGKSFADVALEISIVLFLVLAMQKLLAGRLADTVKSLVVAVVALTSVFFYTACAPQLVRGAVSLTDGVAGVALSTSAHFFWQNQNPGQFKSDLDLGLANAGTAAWETCVADPWAAALFGTSDPNKLKITADEWSIVDKSAFSQDKNKIAELDKKVQNGSLYADTLFLASGDDKARDAVAEMLGQANTLNTGGTLAQAGKQIGNTIGVYEPKSIDHGQHPGTVVGFAPSSNTVFQHVGTAIATFFPALAFFLLVGIIGGYLILSQFMLVLLLIFAPLALFAAMVPDAGWAFATRYFKNMAAFLANKLIFGIYLGGVFALATGVVKGILDNSQAIGLAMAVLTIIYGGALFFAWKFRAMLMRAVSSGSEQLHENIQKTADRGVRNPVTQGIMGLLREWGPLGEGLAMLWQNRRLGRDVSRGFNDVETDLHNLGKNIAAEQAASVPSDNWIGRNGPAGLLGGGKGGRVINLVETEPGVWSMPGVERADSPVPGGRASARESRSALKISPPWAKTDGDEEETVVPPRYRLTLKDAAAAGGDGDKADALLGGYGGRPVVEEDSEDAGMSPPIGELDAATAAGDDGLTDSSEEVRDVDGRPEPDLSASAPARPGREMAAPDVASSWRSGDAAARPETPAAGVAPGAGGAFDAGRDSASGGENGETSGVASGPPTGRGNGGLTVKDMPSAANASGPGASMPDRPEPSIDSSPGVVPSWRPIARSAMPETAAGSTAGPETPENGGTGNPAPVSSGNRSDAGAVKSDNGPSGTVIGAARQRTNNDTQHGRSIGTAVTSKTETKGASAVPTTPRGGARAAGGEGYTREDDVGTSRETGNAGVHFQDVLRHTKI